MIDVAIEELKFGSNLRPSTVSSMNKINEIIGVVNSLSGTDLSSLQADVGTLKTNVSTLQSQMSTANTNITLIQSTNTTQQTDIDKIKVTLYTPLSSDDTTA